MEFVRFLFNGTIHVIYLLYSRSCCIQDTDKVPNTNVESNKDIKIYLTKTKWQQGNRGMDGQYRSENHKVEGKLLFDNSK